MSSSDGTGGNPSEQDVTSPTTSTTQQSDTNELGRDLRSSSPAVKRPASDMGEDTSDRPRRDVDMETPSGSEVNDLDAVENTPKAKQPNRRPRHKRETSVDMLGEDEMAEANSTSNSTIDFSTSPTTDNLTPSSASTFTNSTRSSGLPKGSSAAIEDKQVTPSIDDQVGKILSLHAKPLEERQKGYALTSSWFSRVMARSTHRDMHDAKYDKIDVEGDVGPVDNSDLVLVTDPSLGALKDETGDPFVPFRPNLTFDEDYVMVPKEGWDLIMEWYGLKDGSPVIARYVRNTNTAGDIENLQYELNPPVLTILKLPSPTSSSQLKPPQQQKPIRTLVSRQTPFNSWLKEAKQAAGIDLKTKVQVWRILSGLGGSSSSGVMTPVASRSASPAPGATIVAHAGNSLVLDLAAFSSLNEGSQRELLEDAKDQTANEKYNGSSSMEMAGIGRDDVVLLDEQIGGPAGGEWTSDSAKSTKKTNLSVTVTKSGAPPKSKAATNGYSSPTPGGMVSRGRQRRDGKPRGITGLSNLGNTCYMNSALQCVRSVEELTQYFLSDKWKQDLNPNNPLAYHGEVAKQYASLLTQIYSENAPASFPPRQIKQTIGKYGTNFSGYGQQDSQEFLGFLLDGLQEDLNRVLKKPYIEKPDSTDEMVHDPAALQAMADKCWEIYKARSDSVITDLFGGMYKSTVVCPVCDKVSIIFDPFNNLTLQIPVENLWSKTIFYFPLHKQPVRIDVDIDKNSSIFALKQLLAHKMGWDPRKLIMSEIYKYRFYKMFDNITSIAEASIGLNDDVGVYEVEDIPTNYFPDKVSKPRFSLYSSLSDDDEGIPSFDSPKCDRMLVPIFNRCEKANGGRAKNIFGSPSYTIITREEAMDIDAILKKILVEVATLTSRDILHEDEDEDSEDELARDREDPDTIVTNEEDYSSSDSKIQAGSVESEDGLVDVSMRDDGEATQIIGPASNQRRTSLPRILHPDSFIPAQLQNMYEIKVFKTGNEAVPVGWSTVDEHKEYVSMMSRVPATQPRVNHARRPLLNGDDSSRSSDEDVDDPPAHVSQRPPTAGDDSDYETSSQPKNESDSEGSLPSARNILNHGNRYNGRNSRGQLTYSKKTNKFNKQQHEGGPYLRPGEGIVLDWTPGAFEALFTGNPERPDPMRGAPTWQDIPILQDPELDRQRQIRNFRRKKGFSLDDCLDEFGKAEILSENDAWYCPRCKEHRRASKKFELWKAPDILVIHFKRFSANRGFRDKLDLLVDFPVEGLDLSPRVAMSEDKSLLYDLIAVDNHYGGLGGGHYTAYAKNFVDGNWYEYNDSHVSRRPNPGVVVTHAAYLLFYRRRSSHPLGGQLLEEIVSSAQKAVDSDSPPGSRSESPSGEGQRLDGSSRNGSSSAFRAVGAAHQAGDGGLEESAGVSLLQGPLAPNDDDDDDLPGYSSNDPLEPAETIEGMDIDGVDEGLGHMGMFPQYHPPMHQGQGLAFDEPGWGFDNMNMQSQITHAPPGSIDPDENDNEGLFGTASDKAASMGSEGSDAVVRMVTDFGDDHGTLEGHGFDSTPHRTSPMGTPTIDPRLGHGVHLNVVPSPGQFDDGDDDDLPVVELTVPPGPD